MISQIESLIYIGQVTTTEAQVQAEPEPLILLPLNYPIHSSEDHMFMIKRSLLVAT